MVAALAGFNYQFSVGNGFFRHEQVHHEVYVYGGPEEGWVSQCSA